jgi:hypothetical protein
LRLRLRFWVAAPILALIRSYGCPLAVAFQQHKVLLGKSPWVAGNI